MEKRKKKIVQILRGRQIVIFIRREARGGNYVCFKLYSTNTGGYAIELSMTTLHKHQNRACVRVKTYACICVVCAQGIKKKMEKT